MTPCIFQNITHDPIILGYSNEYLPMFTELKVRQFPPFWENQTELLRFLARAHFSHFATLPGIDQLIKNTDRSICYILFREWYPLFASGCFKRIKQRFPHIKTCWFFSDLVSTYPKINIARMKGEFDLILSFDPQDSLKYGFVHCPLPYCSVPQAKAWQEMAIQTDVFFAGRAKHRLDQILAVYERLRNAGLRCDFHIADAPQHQRRFGGEVDYCTFLPYAECLQMALSSRCILELLQNSDHHGYSARTAEALTYGRKLLSNNLGLKTAPFYHPKQIHIFSEPEHIEPDFIFANWSPINAPALFSPKKTLELIAERLDIHWSEGVLRF